MTEAGPRYFTCPECGAYYRVVGVKAETGKWYRRVFCRICDAPLASVEGENVLKYFLERLPPKRRPG
jgi:transcription elongation factor Elf1